jgi:hypothetical protein
MTGLVPDEIALLSPSDEGGLTDAKDFQRLLSSDVFVITAGGSRSLALETGKDGFNDELGHLGEYSLQISNGKNECLAGVRNQLVF